MLIEYDVVLKESRSIPYSQGHYLPVTGSKVLYNSLNDRLYSYSIDRQQVLEYDALKNSWNDQYLDSLPLTIYWHHNSFFSVTDTSIYTFNGYGQLRYRNNIFRYSFNEGRWEEMHFRGDTIYPRYLSGIGYNQAGDTVYIIGGYGSDDGNQLINPHNYYDLYLVSLANREIKKLYEFDKTGEELCFAHSIIIDKAHKLFYGLIYPKNKPGEGLQLIEGSLVKPVYRNVCSPIPYRFYDIESSADLFFAEDIDLLISVIQQNFDNKQVVSIRTLMFPPAAIPQVPMPTIT